MARSFLADAAAGAESWAVLWCAGAGVIGTPPDALAGEVETFAQFLDSIAGVLDTAPVAAPGFFVLASSAGGVHGGCSDRPITELSPVAPISPYGRAKHAIEESLRQWASRRDVSTLITRISNLYGPGQKLTKPQGLISHMSRAMIHHRAVHIYVPLDTLRDYLYVGDAGQWIPAWTRRLVAARSTAAAPVHILKICAAEEDTTISALVAVFRRIAKRQLAVVNGIHVSSGQQPLKLQFRSRVWPGVPDGLPRTSLLDGIARVYRHQLRLYTSGELPPAA